MWNSFWGIFWFRFLKALCCWTYIKTYFWLFQQKDLHHTLYISKGTFSKLQCKGPLWILKVSSWAFVVQIVVVLIELQTGQVFFLCVYINWIYKLRTSGRLNNQLFLWFMLLLAHSLVVGISFSFVIILHFHGFFKSFFFPLFSWFVYFLKISVAYLSCFPHSKLQLLWAILFCHFWQFYLFKI